MEFSDNELLNMVYEDLGSCDLSAQYLDLDSEVLGRVEFFTREEGICAGISIARRMCELFGGTVKFAHEEGVHVKENGTLLIVEGRGVDLLKVYKVAQNVIEYSCGVATKTAKIVQLAREIYPDIEIATTRKHIVGAKKLSLNAVILGGGVPHRLGLYDSILIFPHYLVFKEHFAFNHKKYRERKVGFEAKSIEEALEYAKDVDIIQLDKQNPILLKEAIIKLKAINPHIIVALAGGINEKNVQEYAQCMPDLIVTSSPYFVKPFDIGTRMIKILKDSL